MYYVSDAKMSTYWITIKSHPATCPSFSGKGTMPTVTLSLKSAASTIAMLLDVNVAAKKRACVPGGAFL